MSDIVPFLRSFRVYDLSVFDMLGSFVAIYVGALVYARYISSTSQTDLTIFFLLVIPATILAHLIFRVQSPLMSHLSSVNSYSIFVVINVFLLISAVRYRLGKV